jgi:hypothetical protein
LRLKDALHSEFDAQEDCFDDQTATAALDPLAAKGRLARAD